jgi:hypothetical protein
MVAADPEAEFRHLRSRVAALEEDKRVLEERLAFAWQEANRIRPKLLDRRPDADSTVRRAPGRRRGRRPENVRRRLLCCSGCGLCEWRDATRRGRRGRRTFRCLSRMSGPSLAAVIVVETVSKETGSDSR